MTDRLVFGGHSTVLLELGGTRLVTDPLLRSRLYGLMRRHHGFSASDVGAVDAVLISHLHQDHLDLPSLRALGRSVRVVVPDGTGGFLAKRGFSRVIELAPGEEVEIEDARVRAVHAAHPGGRMGHGPASAAGYVIEAGSTIYFAGDTDMFDGMAELGDAIDVALLPIWGWGRTVGPGHLNPETAAEAAALIRPRLVVPIHWGALAPLFGRLLWRGHFELPPQRFEAAMASVAPAIKAKTLAPGEALALPA